MELLLFGLIIALLLQVWMNSNGIWEYISLFHLYPDFQVLDDYHVLINDPDATVPILSAYLRERHDSFLARLLSCPICISVWLGLIGSLAFGWGALASAFLGLFCHTLLDRIKANG